MARTKYEIWSRVVGYLRPVSQWNEGKQAEFEERKMFNCDSGLYEANKKTMLKTQENKCVIINNECQQEEEHV